MSEGTRIVQTTPPLVSFLIPVHIRAMVQIDPWVVRVAVQEQVLASFSDHILCGKDG